MRCIDANVIIHALINEKKQDLSPKTIQIKENAKKIVNRLIQGKETVYITTVQISEVINIIDSFTNNETSMRIQRFLIDNPAFEIIETSKKDMLEAHKIVQKYKENKIGLNDAIAYISMKNRGCTEIYTFDSHFNIFPGIQRITE
ncbi:MULTISPECIES: type II toxin-antitoxin system VapC family toxin [Methanobacterium]|uniref:Type II toxin-antitoxin system VapC family toxin n=1 Tax=Methanobacterium veterum TaxID=408577 RepID=A0A9E4ZWL7_9EURY|nr:MULTISPECIES: type II toxin-antitoxin system VapC family toxin [Methanobacterium]MCZ3365672.1 type II toxin-antitoxin system VapC family toxin [Methanobacterium veterum]MCZ3371136.1 type II toxin-antitoxin system VapC family toxin [Methanobacterium veterum]